MKRQRRRLAFNKAGSRGENSSPFSRMDEVRARVNRVSTHLGILVFEERNEASLSLSLFLCGEGNHCDWVGSVHDP